MCSLAVLHFGCFTPLVITLAVYTSFAMLFGFLLFRRFSDEHHHWHQTEKSSVDSFPDVGLLFILGDFPGLFECLRIIHSSIWSYSAENVCVSWMRGSSYSSTREFPYTVGSTLPTDRAHSSSGVSFKNTKTHTIQSNAC